MGHKKRCSFLSTVYVGNSFPFDKCLASYAGDARRIAVGLRVKCTFFFFLCHCNQIQNGSTVRSALLELFHAYRRTKLF